MADDPEEEGWSAERELDPEKLQKEYLHLAKELVGDMKEQKAKAAAEKKQMEEACAQPPMRAMGFAYKPPTFEEVSAKLKRAWEETKKIAPDAPEFVQAEIIRTLMHSHIDDGSQVL